MNKPVPKRQKASVAPQKLVSIVMSSYNAVDTIVEAIESVRRQTYTSWELLVIDDASTDASWDIASMMAEEDKRIRCFRLPKNSGGPALPRNVGIQKARGVLLAFLDADDHWLPEKLSLQVDALVSTQAAIVCTGFHVVNESAGTMGEFVPPPIAGYKSLLRNNSIGCSTALIDITRIGKRYFPPLGHEDYALWLSILREGYSAVGLSQLLSVYRINKGSVSANKLRVLGFFWRIYRKCEGFSALTSLFLILRYICLAKNKYHLRPLH